MKHTPSARESKFPQPNQNDKRKSLGAIKEVKLDEDLGGTKLPGITTEMSSTNAQPPTSVPRMSMNLVPYRPQRTPPGGADGGDVDGGDGLAGGISKQSTATTTTTAPLRSSLGRIVYPFRLPGFGRRPKSQQILLEGLSNVKSVDSFEKTSRISSQKTTPGAPEIPKSAAQIQITLVK